MTDVKTIVDLNVDEHTRRNMFMASIAIPLITNVMATQGGISSEGALSIYQASFIAWEAHKYATDATDPQMADDIKAQQRAQEVRAAAASVHNAPGIIQMPPTKKPSRH